MPLPCVPSFATALLRHTPRADPVHFDWLLDLVLPTPDGQLAEADRVPTFRLSEPLDRCPIGDVLVAERIADHRRLYLCLAEPRELSGDRGTVVPHRRGRIVESNSRDAARSPSEIELVVEWTDGEIAIRQRLRLTPRDDRRWTIKVMDRDRTP